MTFAPIAPTQRVAPEQVAGDTWVIHHAQEGSCTTRWRRG